MSFILKLLLKISRPRFWIYLLGPFLLATSYAYFSFGVVPDFEWVLWFLFWTFPANLWIYGVNDLADRDTDAFNQKKGTKEHLLREKERFILTAALWGALALIIGLTLRLEKFALFWFFLWIFLGTGYSLPPLRFKTRPFLDAYSNVLYALPGFLALWQWAGILPPWWVFVSALAWNAAMHAFSAAPDIHADKKAGLQTVATVLGLKSVLIFCLVNWLIPGLLLAWYWYPASIVFGAYAFIPSLVLLHPKRFPLEKIYWLMPRINMVVGFILFWLMIWA